MGKKIIRGARVIDPSQQIDGIRDVLIEDGCIGAIAESLSEDCPVFDGKGFILSPGLVDIHVHLRDPGFPEKEDIASGCSAAAAGGFTSIACMANTKPVCDSPEVLSYILEKAKTASCRVYPMASVSKGMQGEFLNDFQALKKAGASALSDDGKPIPNSLLYQALTAAKQENLLLSYHAEDLSLTGRGIIHKGKISEQLGVPGVDRASEDVSTAQALALAMDAQAPIHLCHVSTQGALSLIREAKARNIPVTCETAPHYFCLNHEALLEKNANFRMAPPLREESDCRAVLEAIADGTIDCIATDHAPHTEAEKSVFETAPNGIVGLETSLALCLTYLVRPGIISIARLIKMMSTTPARLLGIPGGTLTQGSPADFVLFDPVQHWVIDKRKFHSKGRNTPFDQMEVVGRVKYTFLGGKIVYQDKEGENCGKTH